MTSFQDAEIQHLADQPVDTLTIQSPTSIYCDSVVPQSPSTVTQAELPNIQFRADDIQMLQQEKFNIHHPILREETQNFQQDHQHMHMHEHNNLTSTQGKISIHSIVAIVSNTILLQVMVAMTQMMKSHQSTSQCLQAQMQLLGLKILPHKGKVGIGLRLVPR